MDKETSQPLDHPWLNDKSYQTKRATSSAEIVPASSERTAPERDVSDMASDLVSSLRSEREHRLKQAKKNR
ncbi:hypothetical protein ACFL12_02890 [Pseudomonadota bacterium]